MDAGHFEFIWSGIASRYCIVNKLCHMRCFVYTMPSTTRYGCNNGLNTFDGSLAVKSGSSFHCQFCRLTIKRKCIPLASHITMVPTIPYKLANVPLMEDKHSFLFPGKNPSECSSLNPVLIQIPNRTFRKTSPYCQAANISKMWTLLCVINDQSNLSWPRGLVHWCTGRNQDRVQHGLIRKFQQPTVGHPQMWKSLGGRTNAPKLSGVWFYNLGKLIGLVSLLPSHPNNYIMLCSQFPHISV